MKRIALFFLFLIVSFLFSSFSSKVSAQGITININPRAIKNNDFSQLLGAYLAKGINQWNLQDFSDQNFIDAAKQILPQPPANPPVMRLADFSIGEVGKIATFCKNVNCDPMFGFYDNDQKSDNEIKAFVSGVKNTCDSVFGDSRHCRNWDIGNEPAQNCYKPSQFANGFYRLATIIKGVMPEAKLFTLELDYYAKKIQAGGCSYSEVNVNCPETITVGECILRILDKKTPQIKIDVAQTHWYPYYAGHIEDNLVNGLSILSFNGITQGADSQRQKMTDVFTSFNNINSYLRNYEVSREAAVGFGEISVGAFPSAAAYPNIGGINAKWGSTFWFLDELGMMAEAGYKYAQKHVLNGVAGFGLLGLHGERIPTSYAYEFYAKYFGDRVVETTCSNPAVLNAHSSLDREGNLRIILINKSSGQRQTALINLADFNAGTNGQAYILRIPGGGDFNRMSSNETGVVIETRSVNVGQSFSYDVDGYTAVILKVPKTDGGCQASSGDANKDGQIDLNDFEIWRREALGLSNSRLADFNCDGSTDLNDFEIWRRNFLGTR